MRPLMHSLQVVPSRRRRDESSTRARRGFSIIEAIIAIVLIAFGVLALASSSVMTIRELRASSQRVNDAALAATNFERLRTLENCTVMAAKAATIPGMTSELVAIPGSPRMLKLRYVLPVPAGVRAASQEYRSNVPCAL